MDQVPIPSYAPVVLSPVSCTAPDRGALPVFARSGGMVREVRPLVPTLRALPSLAAALALSLLAGVVAAGPVEDEIRRISSSIEGGTGHTPLAGLSPREDALLAAVYERRGYAPAWYGRDNAQELIAELGRGVAQGFLPQDFLLPLLLELQEEARSEDPSDIAAFDLVATDAAIRLVHHLVFGKVDPAAVDDAWNFDRPVFERDPADVLNAALDGDGFAALMDKVHIDAPSYQALVDALALYRAIAAEGGWPEVPDRAVLRPGMTDPAIPLLRERLAREGVDLPRSLAAATPSASATDTRYDDTLVAAVKAFQARHGLEADGIVGRDTFLSLNRTAAERVDQLRLSLERARWIMRDLDDEFVIVNIAAARTFLVRQDAVWTTRSVTGSAYRQTPVFRDEIEYIEFNPTWTVPASIFQKDKLPLIRKDLQYLSRNDYDVVASSDRSPINPATVDWSAPSPPVTLVQRPGPGNALGRVKFMFPNKHAVYLHDTNDPGLFDRNERNLSSGCVRLEYPFELAALLLEGRPDWTPARLQEILESGKTTRVQLEEPMPVLLTYWTAWIEDGVVHFREDPYGRDGPLLEALNR